MVPTSVDGNVRRWEVNARPRPREHPVTRYEAMWDDERMKDRKRSFRERARRADIPLSMFLEDK
jgi:hypothetical protein